MKIYLTAALAALVVAGCATSDVATDDGEQTDVVQSAQSTCGSANYATALQHYQNAVAWSKERLEFGACGSEHGMLIDIANEASRAVMTCADFRQIIRTSPWAPALRQVLAPTLTYRSISGELLVIRDSVFQNWTGTERFFDQGLTFWATSVGAYGPPIQIDFLPNGGARWRELHFDEVTGDISICETPSSYAIVKTTDRAKRKVIVYRGSQTIEYWLSVENPGAYRDAPWFVLSPTQGGEKLYSLRGECDA